MDQYEHIVLNRYQFKDQLLSTSLDSGSPINILLKAVVLLIDPKLPWSCKTVSYFLQQNIHQIFREVVISGKVHYSLSLIFASSGKMGKHIMFISLFDFINNNCNFFLNVYEVADVLNMGWSIILLKH
ncbi:hypothetical protein R6Q59_010803 [Mikania micrantha]